MKYLTHEEKCILKSLGYSSEDFEQIERAMQKSKTTYKLVSLKNGSEKSKFVDKETAICILGNIDYLSGIARSAFHWTAYRENQELTYAILFDSSALFRQKKKQ